MSILSDAWRRARGEDDAVARALGAPPPQQGGRRVHWLPWLLCCLLLIVVVGLSVYLWRTHRLTGASVQSASTATLKAPVRPTAAAGQAGTRLTDGAQASPAASTVAHAPVNTSPVSGKAAAPRTASVARATGAAAASGTAPESVRAQLPELTVTVHVWNPQPASRFIVVNGHIYHEGDELPQGLRLVSITQDGEIVNFEGYLITLNGH